MEDPAGSGVPQARPARWPLVAAGLAAVGQLVAGWFYLVSGLVSPPWAVVTLLLWWSVLTAAGLRLARRRSYAVLGVPLVAVVTWLLMVGLGGAAFGWTA